MKKFSPLVLIFCLLTAGIVATAFDEIFFDIVNLNKLKFLTSNQQRSVAMQSPSTLSANWTLTLPPNTGTSGQVLRTDGAGTTTWVTSGGGGSGTVTSVSVTTQNGVSATVTNPTTTPALAFTLGAITPSSIVDAGTFAFSGSQNFNSFSGNGLKVVTGTGTYTSGHGTVIDASGNVVDSGSPGGGGVTNLTGTTNQVNVSASTGAVTLSLPNTLVLPGVETVSGGGVYKGTTLFTIGDSIAFGAGGVNPFPLIIGTDATWTVNNTNAVPGAGTSDSQQAVDGATITTATNSVFEIGTNDMDAYWANAGNAANATLAQVYKQAAQYEVAELAIPNGNRFGGNSGSITLTGVWTNFPAHAPAMQSSLGTASWSTPGGRAIYVNTELVVGNLGTFTLTVDGTPLGITYNCFSSQNITSLLGSTIVPQMIRIDNILGVPLTDIPHTVVLTITSANDASHLVYLNWVGWSIGQRNLVGPNVFVNGITKKTAGGYVTFGSNDANTATYNQIIRDNVQLLSNDGLNVTFVDNANILTASMLQADGLHPNQTGQNLMAVNNEEEINGAVSTRIKGQPIDTDLNRQFLGSTVALAPTTQIFWGAATASFPMIKRTTTALNFRLANDSADAGITALRLTFPTNVAAATPNVLWNTSDGFYSASAGDVSLAIVGVLKFAFENNTLFVISNTGQVIFGTSADGAIGRQSAGLLEINSGTLGCNAAAASCRDLTQRHNLANGTAPTIASGFGTGSTIAGRDEAFRVTLGTTPGTGGVATFGTAYTNAPVCDAVDETTLTVNLTTTATTTNVTITAVTGVILLSDKIAVMCRGYL